MSRKTRFNIYRDGEMHVVDHMCSTCIFRAGNLMNLDDGRRDEMVRASLKVDSAIVCHSTLGTKENAVCRGFYDNHCHETVAMRLASIMGVVVFDAPRSLK
jgi:hypothetical protein